MQDRANNAGKLGCSFKSIILMPQGPKVKNSLYRQHAVYNSTQASMYTMEPIDKEAKCCKSGENIIRHNNVLIATEDIYFDEHEHAENNMLFALGRIFYLI